MRGILTFSTLRIVHGYSGVSCLSPRRRVSQLVVRPSNKAIAARVMSPICCIEFPEARDSPAIGVDTVGWAKRVIEEGNEAFPEDETATFHSTSLPDLTVIINNNGIAELLVSAQDSIPYTMSNPDSQYPARFRILPATILGLPEEECKKRAQRFAVGSLIYQIMAGRPPFADLEESIVQQNFERGIYPVETEFPLEITIPMLGFWSQEFAQHCIGEIARASSADTTNSRRKIFGGVAVVGLGLFGVASLAVPVLGLVGFSALGPIAGSAAAAWQAGIGLVQAGSLFAGCQSVAMGGMAGTIMVAQGIGGVAGLAALGGMLSRSEDKQAAVQTVWNLFTRKVRKVGRDDATEAKEEGGNE